MKLIIETKEPAMDNKTLAKIKLILHLAGHRDTIVYFQGKLVGEPPVNGAIRLTKAEVEECEKEDANTRHITGYKPKYKTKRGIE